MKMPRRHAVRILRGIGVGPASTREVERHWAGLEPLEARQLMNAAIGIESVLQQPAPLLDSTPAVLVDDEHGEDSEDHGSGCGCEGCRRMRQVLSDGTVLDIDMLGVPDLTLTPDYGPEFATATTTSSGVGPIMTPTSLSQTFLLHSNATAKHKIYLDFDGHTTTGTYWNSGYTGGAAFTTAAFDTDGNTAVFSDAELSRIQAIWQRVAEDFAPFNVDVTTEQPPVDQLIKSGFSDTAWGVRVVVGGSSSDWLKMSAGGVAYVSSFNWNTDTPVFVFENNLANGDEKYTAEAITHEVGHSLGLNHDGQGSTAYYQGHGSGDTGWAPIMGVGYYRNLTQWSKGEYTSPTNVEDDVTKITTLNGFTYRADAVGNTLAASSAMTLAGSTVSGAGIIERAVDVDVWSFTTGSGGVNFTVNPAARGANLDVMAELLDSAGQVILASNPASLLSATLATTLTAGTYYLRVSGVGNGTGATGYTDYASLGQYFIAGTITPSTTYTTTTTPTTTTTNTTTTNTTTNTTTTPTTTNNTPTPPPPAGAFSINDVTIDESAGLATFTVKLSQAQSKSSTVNVATVNGTALSGVDYTALSKTLTFAAGQTSQTVAVSLVNDVNVESTENFSLKLSNASAGLTIADDTGLATITDNDVSVSVAGSSVVETNPGLRNKQQTTDMVFTFTLSAPTNQAVTLTYATSSGTAKSGSDFIAATGSMTFKAGEVSKTVTVKVIGDRTAENNETVKMNIKSISGAEGKVTSAVGTILDNDGGGSFISAFAQVVDDDAMSALLTDLFQWRSEQTGRGGASDTSDAGSNTLRKLRISGSMVDLLKAS